ncbi:hypothetical protein [Candidatus Ichthyocystis sparus]|uniref:hypothetical protein n=1 Tax=Candidatus Ichthyocystis sparus TaxID=1561004 RepID=UPI00159ED8D9|nr:hypothetical protein [Candidatus Ichthyocystis sparus]
MHNDQGGMSLGVIVLVVSNTFKCRKLRYVRLLLFFLFSPFLVFKPTSLLMY